MYNNPYNANYNPNFAPQSLNERIDNQIAQLNQMKEQIKNNQQPAINQTFQLAPNHPSGMRYANTIDDVSKENVYGETPFFSKDMTILWVKNAKGEIKTYELKEIIPKDERDLLIESLQMQVAELRKEIKDNAKPINNDDDESTSSEKSSNVQSNRTVKKK